VNIEYVNFGIASRYGSGLIEINKKLLEPEYEDLLNEILNHELAHSNNYGIRDLALDIKGFKHKKQYWTFVLTTPNSWVQFIPINYRNRTLIFDRTIFIGWAIGFVLLLIILKWIW
jgi:hypothetical protein